MKSPALYSVQLCSADPQSLRISWRLDNEHPCTPCYSAAGNPRLGHELSFTGFLPRIFALSLLSGCRPSVSLSGPCECWRFPGLQPWDGNPHMARPQPRLTSLTLHRLIQITSFQPPSFTASQFTSSTRHLGPSLTTWGSLEQGSDGEHDRCNDC